MENRQIRLQVRKETHSVLFIRPGGGPGLRTRHFSKDGLALSRAARGHLLCRCDGCDLEFSLHGVIAHLLTQLRGGGDAVIWSLRRAGQGTGSGGGQGYVAFALDKLRIYPRRGSNSIPRRTTHEHRVRSRGCRSRQGRSLVQHLAQSGRGCDAIFSGWSVLGVRLECRQES